MGFGKRQLILAALVVSLGAAVYLNWQFSDHGQITAVDANASGQELGAAQLVNGSVVSSEDDEISMGEESASETIVGMESSVASSDAVEEIQQTEGNVTEDYFTEASINRQKTRDEAVELLNGILNNSEATAEETQQAVEQSSVIAKNMLSESNIESMVRSKGYTNCVAFIQNDECSLVVGKETEFTEEDAAAIRDIVVDQSSVPYSNIKIVDHVTA